MRLEILILETFILGLMENGTKIHGKNFQLKNIDTNFYASDYYDVNVNKYGVKCEKFCCIGLVIF